LLRGIQFHMSMYLAAILGLCVLTTPSVAAIEYRAQPQRLSQETQPPGEAPSVPAQDSPQNAAPTTSSSQPGAEPQSEPPATPAPEAAQEPQTGKPEAAAKKPEPKTKAATKKRRRRKAAASPSTATPEKKVVRNGGTVDPAVQLAPGMSAEQASSQRQNTSQLLAATDANLKRISSRPMNSSQQASVSQIRKYMEQAKAAEQAGDVQRAQNLASKALLLSDDLAKQ
jgi:hypothetical protein